MEAVCVLAHFVAPGSLQAKQLHHLHAQLPLGQRYYRQKKKKKKCLVFMCTGLLRSCLTLCDPVDWPVRLLCQRGGSPSKNTGAYWPILVSIPFWSTIFPTTLAAKPPESLVLPEPLQTKQLYHLHTWPSQGQTQALQGSLRSQTPVDNPHAEVEIKPQLKPRGSVAKE